MSQLEEVRAVTWDGTASFALVSQRGQGAPQWARDHVARYLAKLNDILS